jgi:hypothetical protein
MESTLLLGNIYYEATILSLQQSWVTFIYEATGEWEQSWQTAVIR